MTRTPKHPAVPDADHKLSPDHPGTGSRTTSRRAFLRKSGALVSSGVVLATLDANAQEASRATESGASPPAIPE